MVVMDGFKSKRWIFTSATAAAVSFLGTWAVASLSSAVWALIASAVASALPVVVTAVLGAEK